MKNKNLFKIGEIADIYEISVQTLRHYENLGLLHPSYVDPDTHYRYYGIEQTEVLNMICYLRTLDTPLSAIRSFLENRNIEKMEQMLIHQQNEIQQKITLLQNMQNMVQRRLQILDSAKTNTLDQVQVIQSPKLNYIYLKNHLQPKSYLDLETSILQLKKEQKQSVVFLGNVGVGLSKDHFIQQQYEFYDYVFILLNSEDQSFQQAEIIPASTTLSIQFKGNHTNAIPSYQKLYAYMQENQWIPNGFAREITLIDEGLTSDISQYVTEIQVPVEKGTL